MQKKSKYNVAVVGATGAVGRVMLSILEERKFPVDRLLPLASSRSAGGQVEFNGQKITVEELKADSFEGIDIGLFSAGGSVSLEFGPRGALPLLDLHLEPRQMSPDGAGCLVDNLPAVGHKENLAESPRGSQRLDDVCRNHGFTGTGGEIEKHAPLFLLFVTRDNSGHRAFLIGSESKLITHRCRSQKTADTEIRAFFLFGACISRYSQKGQAKGCSTTPAVGILVCGTGG